MEKSRHNARKILAKLLKSYRVNAGMTQYEIAEKTRTPQPIFSKIESGERKVELYELLLILNAMSVSISVFTTEYQEKLDEAN